MNAKLYLSFLLLLSGAAVRGQTKNNIMETTRKPVTCRLTTPELQKRKSTVIAELKALVVERKELENGYSYKFEGSDVNLDRLTEFIKTERMCCDFFVFQLTVEDEEVVLLITGPEEAKQFLKEEIDL